MLVKSTRNSMLTMHNSEHKHKHKISGDSMLVKSTRKSMLKSGHLFGYFGIL